jgi:hypothetical protein
VGLNSDEQYYVGRHPSGAVLQAKRGACPERSRRDLARINSIGKKRIKEKQNR